MRTIGIDARLISRTGVGVYIRNLLFYLQKKAPDFLFYIYLLKEDFARFNFFNRNFIKKQADYRWHTYKEQLQFFLKLYQDNLDLMHFTYFSYPVLYRRPFVATVHDMTPFFFKTGKASTKNPVKYEIKYFFFRQVLTSQIKNAKKIIVPCRRVKKQITAVFGEKYQNKIFPIYEGINYELMRQSENQTLAKIFPDPFFIYVGNFYPHKNVENLIKAFMNVKSRVSLILVGPDDFFANRLNHLINHLKQKKIFFYKNPKAEDLVFFYKHAQALLHPSLSEGFGLPLIEAAYYNCPIIASDIPVFRELLGENYLKFNPLDIEDISKKIEFFIETKPKFNYNDFNKKYSFEKMTEQILELYQS